MSRTVLIVDDEPSVMAPAADSLSHARITTRATTDGTETVKALRAAPRQEVVTTVREVGKRARPVSAWYHSQSC